MAVFTHINESDLEIFLKNYNLNKLNFIEGINEGIQNTNYKVGIDSKDFILTIYENIPDNNDINFFLELMMHLSSNNIKCPTPIKNLENTSIGKIKSKPSALLTFLEGKSISAITKNHTFEIGKALAEMHVKVENFNLNKKNDLSFDGWDKLIEKNQKKLDILEIDLYENLKGQQKKIKNAWPKNLPSGIIHADLFPDNVLFLDNKVSGLIDFYFSCNDFFAYDLSICINAWCFNEDNNFSKENFKTLVNGYHEVRPLSEKELNSLPVLCSGSALRFLLTRVDNWNSSKGIDIVNYQDPREFLERLNFHSKIDDLKGYGI
jgi:homoserine kinase type II|tara:strand:+ start:69 stop:1028 length:960 start_codon:yes stop_codon:yes gene_type:complete